MRGTAKIASQLPFFQFYKAFFNIAINRYIVINPENEMAPHSSTLAWKIPWMEEPGRLQSMGSLRVRHN